MTALDHRSFMAGKNESGARIAMEMEARIQDPERRDEVTAKHAALIAGLEGPSAALVVAEPLLERASGRAYVWSAIAAGYALTRSGRLGKALEVAAHGYAEHNRLPDPLEWYPWTHLFVRAEALASSGQLTEAHQLSAEQYEKGLLERSPEAQAWFSWQLCKTVLDRGYPLTAAVHGRSAVALFRQLGQPQFQHFALGHLSLALALGGRIGEAKNCLDTMDELGLGCPLYWACDVFQARAWVAVMEGDEVSGRRLLDEGRRVAHSVGDHVGEAATLHTMARLGIAQQSSERLSSLARDIDGQLVVLRSTHVQALGDSDPQLLDDVSVAYEGCGAQLLAAEAAANAAMAWHRSGDSRQGAKSERRCNALAEDCENPATPVLQAARSRAQLTKAERNVARLAASGATNRDIAARLYVSPRTVENQLQHVYQKLGVASRRELSHTLEPAGDPT
jgi:DNA-binding CsgD family transcriptional regulator